MARENLIGRYVSLDPGRSQQLARVLLGVIAVTSMATAALAMRRTSTTFDEIIMMAAGARGFALGRFDLQPEHPPIGQYLYGLPVYLTSPHYPPEPDQIPPHMGYRYRYSRSFFGSVGNDPEHIAFLGRLSGVLCAGLLILAVWRFTKPWGEGAAVLAAGLVAFVPDVLAHAGVAYNDVPLALCYLLSLWAADRALRKPTLLTGAVAGAAFALALGVKFSAVGLIPAIGLLLAFEAMHRRFERRWIRDMVVALFAAGAASYLTLVLAYRGELDLFQFRYGLGFTFRHVGEGHGVSAYLLGHTSPTGWWYFYPVAFLFKTPAALHALILLAVVGFVRNRPNWRNLFGTRLRAPVIGALVFGAALLQSNLNIGFRYALPMLPLLCIVTAIGAMRLWTVSGRAIRFAIVGLTVWYAGATLSHYPFFLSYISEYGPGRGDDVLLDSSLDWGQGLLALRDFMRERNIDRVSLSYFGSALPESYGIRYVALPSYHPLPGETEVRPPGDEPDWLVVSATNLHGLYLNDDPFRDVRARRPDAILAGGSLLAYRLR